MDVLKVKYSLDSLDDDDMERIVCHPLKGENHAHDERQVVCRTQTQLNPNGRRSSWRWYLCVPHGMEVLKVDQDKERSKVLLSSEIAAIQSLWNAFSIGISTG